MYARLVSTISAFFMAIFLSTAALAETVTVTDVLDRTVDVPAKAERILVGFYFEDVFAVGGPNVYDRVVAISREAWEGWRNFQWKAYTAAVPKIKDIADVGEVDGGTFSLEKALAARPQVALFAAWQFNALKDTIGRLEAAGVPVVVLDYNAQVVEKHVKSTLALGTVLGQPERAKKLADTYEKAVADVVARVAKIKERPKVHFELGRKGADEAGFSWGDVMWGRLVEVAGGQNIAKDQIAKWGPVNPEFVLAQNPEAVFLAGSGWVGKDKAVIMGPTVNVDDTHARMKPYKQRPGWSELDAIKSGKVFAVYHGGTRTLYDFAFLQFIAKSLHPEAFADVDPQKNLEKHFEEFMPIPLKGAFMTQLP
ncbi:MAG: ABC transporter substrate-binding protein [Pseudomonadota bacterium]